jgi:hypothetical protein
MELMAITMLRAILAGARYPPDGIADTPEHRRLWDGIVASVEGLPPGVLPDIPADWAD